PQSTRLCHPSESMLVAGSHRASRSMTLPPEELLAVRSQDIQPIVGPFRQQPRTYLPPPPLHCTCPFLGPYGGPSGTEWAAEPRTRLSRRGPARRHSPCRSSR